MHCLYSSSEHKPPVVGLLSPHCSHSMNRSALVSQNFVLKASVVWTAFVILQLFYPPVSIEWDGTGLACSPCSDHRRCI